MFNFAILIGIYSYIILTIGLLKYLYRENIIFLIIIFFLITVYWYRNLLIMNLLRCFETSKKVLKFFSLDKLSQLMIILLFLQGVINLTGALGPELGFDALWYHLTLAKLYLINHSIDYIPGGLLYYSTMPKLTEMLYVTGLAFGNEIFAKLIHFSFGILSLIALFKVSRKFFSSKFALLTCVIFYSNLVAGWMSITAYVDLARTFFEIMALWGFLNWLEKREKKWLIESAVMLGLAISTKLLAVGSLLIFLVLIVLFYYRHSGKRSAPRISQGNRRFWTRRVPDGNPSSQNNGNNSVLRNLFSYWFIALLIPSPWFVFSFIHTGNPVYPFFENI